MAVTNFEAARQAGVRTADLDVSSDGEPYMSNVGVRMSSDGHLDFNGRFPVHHSYVFSARVADESGNEVGRGNSDPIYVADAQTQYHARIPIVFGVGGGDVDGQIEFENVVVFRYVMLTPVEFGSAGTTFIACPADGVTVTQTDPLVVVGGSFTVATPSTLPVDAGCLAWDLTPNPSMTTVTPIVVTLSGRFSFEGKTGRFSVKKSGKFVPDGEGDSTPDGGGSDGGGSDGGVGDGGVGDGGLTDGGLTDGGSGGTGGGVTDGGSGDGGTTDGHTADGGGSTTGDGGTSGGATGDGGSEGGMSSDGGATDGGGAEGGSSDDGGTGGGGGGSVFDMSTDDGGIGDGADAVDDGGTCDAGDDGGMCDGGDSDMCGGGDGGADDGGDAGESSDIAGT